MRPGCSCSTRLKPNTHRRRRRDSPVELRRVGVGSVCCLSSVDKLFLCPRRMWAVLIEKPKLVPVLGRRLQAVNRRHVRTDSHLRRRRRCRAAVAQSVADRSRARWRESAWVARAYVRFLPRDEGGDVVLDGSREGDVWRGRGTLRLRHRWRRRQVVGGLGWTVIPLGLPGCRLLRQLSDVVACQLLDQTISFIVCHVAAVADAAVNTVYCFFCNVWWRRHFDRRPRRHWNRNNTPHHTSPFCIVASNWLAWLSSWDADMLNSVETEKFISISHFRIFQRLNWR